MTHLKPKKLRTYLIDEEPISVGDTLKIVMHKNSKERFVCSENRNERSGEFDCFICVVLELPEETSRQNVITAKNIYIFSELHSKTKLHLPNNYAYIHDSIDICISNTKMVLIEKHFGKQYIV